MRVAIIGTRGFRYVYSGYETFVARVAPALARRGHDVTVYCHRGLFKQRPAAVDGVKLVYVPGITGKNISQLSHSILSILHASLGRYDAVLAVSLANGPLGLMLKVCRIPSILNVDGMEWLRPKWRGLGAAYFRLAARVAPLFYDVLITDADAMAEVYRGEFDADSVMIEYGADIARSERPELIKRFGLEPQRYFIVVGRLIPDNNADLLIRGYARARVARPLVVVGDVPYSDTYAASVRAMAGPAVVFAGYVRDQDVLRELYCNCRAYLHGHEFGGTNPTLLQGLASGCAIGALDTAFSREVLAEGRYGVLFHKNEEAVGEAISRLDEDDRLTTALQERARERILERYSWERIIDRYEEVLYSVVRRATRRPAS